MKTMTIIMIALAVLYMLGGYPFISLSAVAIAHFCRLLAKDKEAK